jgi:hypothetical protein
MAAGFRPTTLRLMKAYISMRRSARALTPEARHILDMLAAWPDGALEPVLLAHGFHHKRIVTLIGAGLVTGNIESTLVGGQQTLTVRIRITQAGRSARQSEAKRKRA